MADTRAKLTLNDDIAIELNVLKDTPGQDAIDTRSFGSKGMFTFDPGSTSAASCESKITLTGGDEGVLLHRGFPINQLAVESNYLGVCYILPYSEESTQEEYDEFRTTAIRRTMTREQITRLFHDFRHNSHPMAVMCGITGTLAASCRDSSDMSNTRHREITAFHLLPKMSTMVVTCYKYSIGQPFTYPHNDLPYAGNFLNMMFSTLCEKYEVDPILEHVMDHILILYAGHEQNASVFVARTAGSSGADPSACIAADIASLWGPVHGGVDEAALKMLGEIGSARHILEFVYRAKDKNNSFHLMGFDHRTYKDYGPRATVMRKACHEVPKGLGIRGDLLEVAMELEHIALSDPYFIEKKLYPNVDFYSGIILRATGIPSSIFTAILAMARTISWAAHWNEMYIDGIKIVRPHRLHTGYDRRNFKSDIKR